MDARFFTLEGGEGSGKTTQRELLKQRFSELFPNYELDWTREPGGTPFAEMVRTLIFSDEAQALDGTDAYHAFALARGDHIKNRIRPNLDKGMVVISDRFAAATFAYQSRAMENPISEDEFRYYYDGLAAKPALTIVFDIDPELAAERLKERYATEGGEYNHFDRRPLEFHQAVREGYLDFDRFAPTCVIDASRSKEEIFDEMVACLREHLPPR